MLCAIDLFPHNSEQVVTEAIASSQDRHVQEIVNSAVMAGLDKESAIDAALAGGAKEEELAKIN